MPDAGNFFEATTLYFGKKPALSHVCNSRAEAELLFSIAEAGLRGPVSIPDSEDECERFSRSLAARLFEGRAKLEELAHARAGTDKLREQTVELLYRWFILGKPND